MDTILRDECYRELQLAVEACKDYTPLTAMQYYIEAEENPEVAEVKAKNEKAASSAWEHIKNAIKAIRMAISSLISKVSEVFSKAAMDKQTKEAYEAFKAACKENPELAKKKVTVEDFRKSEEVYQKILKETEEAEKQLAAGRRVDVPAVIKKCEEYATNMGKGVATAVGAQTLLNIARSNQSAAGIISFALNADADVLKGLENQLGTKNTQDLNNEVAKLTGRCTLYRFRLKMHKKYFDDIGSSFMGAINGLKDAAMPGPKRDKGNAKDMDKLLKGNETAARTMNARDEAFKTAAKEVAKDKINNALNAPRRRAEAKAEARREAKGDYSGADIGTYLKYNIDKLRGKK